MDMDVKATGEKEALLTGPDGRYLHLSANPMQLAPKTGCIGFLRAQKITTPWHFFS
ncbi:hypothetical protein LJC22_04035 [Desulfosarcina sp. OttesenSCG-928-G10]|nr:hypothetical protein [Desulfosarcina sp. OttesenSCG-928-G10]MDL2321154.1 hypothetical protein [Desulfosarcina sp. OttesenSCG-928-B08]